MKKCNVIELFAGVGGFRIGLDRADSDFYNVVWANQWEPATKIQHAAMVYEARFGKGSICNLDITTVKTEDIPDHDILVGGFPCQDYSVATTLSNSKGIEGKKGVLWWSIYRILKEKGDKMPEMVFLENVDRLLLSPAKQRGRDFAIILECLNELGYIVEWRVINAAEYAMPQKRRRTYIVGYKKDSKIATGFSTPAQWIYKDGVFAKAFPIVVPEAINDISGLKLSNKKKDRLVDITDNFNSAQLDKPFSNSGVMLDGVAYSLATIPVCDDEPQTIKSIMAKGDDIQYVTEEFYIPDSQIGTWKDLKGPKRIEKVSKTGFKYIYSEGGLSFPDDLDKPSRTIITSEGGKSPDRCRHVIIDQTGRYRRLIPLELERLNMFPDHHTALDGVSDGKRAFLMGNALVCGIVTAVGTELARRLK